jgi:hypothetical protein
MAAEGRGPLLSRPRRNIAGEESWRRARVLRSQRHSLGEAEAEAGSIETSSAPSLSLCGRPATKLLFLLRNRTFSIYARFDVALTRLTGAGYILELFDFRTRAAERKNACGFLQGVFEMLLEIIAAIVLIHGCSILSQLIERQRDVLYYVSRPDPRW